jgi:hypothetical protein
VRIVVTLYVALWLALIANVVLMATGVLKP